LWCLYNHKVLCSTRINHLPQKFKEQKEMQFLKDKKATSAIALFLVLTFAVSLIALPLADAHTPAWEFTTYAYISVAPNPVGVNQQVLIVFWLDLVIQGASLDNNIRFHNYQLTITKPDNKTETITVGTVTDPTSSTFYPYTPDQTGTYILNFTFPGQEYTYTQPLPSLFGPPVPNTYTNDTYTSSSATTTLTVQEEPVPKLPETPLPTEYWMRPINGQNVLWDSVSSNWLGGAANSANTDVWQRSGSAPTSAHIMWSKIYELGGLTGGSQDLGATYYAGFSYETRFADPLVVSGILYYLKSLNHAGGGGGYAAVDLRTGEEIWSSDYLGGAVAGLGAPPVSINGGVAAPSKAQLYDLNNPDQHGVVSGILWQVVGSTWNAYDALTGKWIFNLTNVPSGTEVYTDQGEILRYVFNYGGRWLALWNDTATILTSAVLFGIPGWRPLGQTIDASQSAAYSWNVSIPDLPGDTSPTIVGVIPGDVILGRSSNVGLTSQASPNHDPWTLWALNLNETKGDVGSLLWIKHYPAPANNITRMLAWQPIDPVYHTFTMTDFETGQRLGYSLDTGDLLWGPVGPSNIGFQYYSSREGFPAYGNLYVTGYGGIVYCYSMKNGTLLWTYGNGGAGNSTSSGDETPWGRYPTHGAAVADGIIYTMSGEHSPNKPLYKGYRVRAINATTGEELWTLLDWSASGLGTSVPPVAIADGYMAFVNAYDGKLYCVGKGPSETTVTASPKVSVFGDKVLVEGTIADISAGAKQKVQDGEYSMVPAMSDASMTAWMEHVYMQQPLPANTTGVNIIISVVDPNDNCYEVARATSDTSGFFSAVFTPLVPGLYTVYASFEGSNSYWPSQAVTSINVEEAPTTTPSPTPVPEAPVGTYFTISTILIIVAIAIVAVLILRKH
jgi:hypothetical protein